MLIGWLLDKSKQVKTPNVSDIKNTNILGRKALITDNALSRNKFKLYTNGVR